MLQIKAMKIILAQNGRSTSKHHLKPVYDNKKTRVKSTRVFLLLCFSGDGLCADQQMDEGCWINNHLNPVT